MRSREQYLAALGIEQWLPRAELPGVPVRRIARRKLAVPTSSVPAKREPEALTPASTVSTASATTAAATASPGAAETPSLAERIKQDLTATPSAVKPARSDVADKEVKTPEQRLATQKFQIRLYHWAEPVLVVDESGSKQGSEAKLLAAILAAMGYQANIAHKPTDFDWPQARLTGAAPDDLLTGIVSGILQREASAGRIKALLLLGDIPARLLAQQAFADLQVIHSHSLAAMLQQPALKAEVWRAVQPLRIDAP